MTCFLRFCDFFLFKVLKIPAKVLCLMRCVMCIHNVYYNYHVCGSICPHISSLKIAAQTFFEVFYVRFTFKHLIDALICKNIHCIEVHFY